MTTRGVADQAFRYAIILTTPFAADFDPVLPTSLVPLLS